MDDDMEKMINEMQRKAEEMIKAMEAKFGSLEELGSKGFSGENIDFQSIAGMQKEMQELMAGVTGGMPNMQDAMQNSMRKENTGDAEKKMRDAVIESEDGADIEKMMKEMMRDQEKQ